MPDVPRPPVSEVVHSIALARQPALSGPMLPSVLGDWFVSHPRVESAPPYEIPPEPANLAASAQGPRIQLMSASPLPRYWLISDDDQELIQAQPDYLALNWRNQSDVNDYPGYPEMRERFHRLLRAAEDGLSKHQGALKPIRAELTYINTIGLDRKWPSHHDTGKVIRISLPPEISYERIGFTYSNPLTGPNGEFAGRLHVTLNPAVDWIKQEPQLSLNLTARSADFSRQTVGEVLEFMDIAHSAIEEAFKNLISKEAHQAWGLL